MKLKKLGSVGLKEDSVFRFSLRFGFEQFFPVPRRAFPLIGNDARDGGRNPGISRRPASFRAFV